MHLPSVYQSLEYASRKPLRKYRKYLKWVEEYADDMKLRDLSDEELKAMWHREVVELHALSLGSKNPNDVILDEDAVSFIFAFAREVTWRLLGKFQYDVQVLGGLAAMDRNAIQMSTGSGKTLTLILPVVAFGLTHKGVYVLTVNDYLSKRDWEETRPVYEWFGLTSSYVQNSMSDIEQRKAFESDVIYCTNSTLGFAYLNSVLASDIGQDVKPIHRPLYSAIIDECDEILLDDARNPLIIADGAGKKDGDMTVEYDGKSHSVQHIVDILKTSLHNLKIDDDDPSGMPHLDDRSMKEIQKALDIHENIFDNPALVHVISSAVSAIFNYHDYQDYVVADRPDKDTGSKIILIDKATGRLARGRTMNDGMHAFLEMKEGVYSGQDTKSSIQITYQILFNLFETIAGVSGTLGASYQEFTDIYGMDLVVIPDRLPSQLVSRTRLYTTSKHLEDDLVRLVRFYTSAHRPILIGAKSDIHAYMLSDLLNSYGIDHKLLVSTDKNEDEIVESAGEPGSIVVTTDIMGRGTDIKPSDTAGERGLVVLQVGLRPNSRVERQFAGRAGRQGQPGRYERLLSLPDLLDIDVPQAGKSEILGIQRANRELIEYHHADILLGGKSPDYDRIVAIIDDALTASESRASASRVEDFKAYSIVDLMQVSLSNQMDDVRRAIKENLENDNQETLNNLAHVLATFSIPKTTKRAKKKIKANQQVLETIDSQQLRIAAFNYTRAVIDKVIPGMREASEGMISSVKLAGAVQYAKKPEDMMVELLKDYLATQQDILLFDFKRYA